MVGPHSPTNTEAAGAPISSSNICSTVSIESDWCQVFVTFFLIIDRTLEIGISLKHIENVDQLFDDPGQGYPGFQVHTPH